MGKRHIDFPLRRLIIKLLRSSLGVIRLPYTSLHSSSHSVDRNIGSYNYMTALASDNSFGLV
jgi:hypothetical protein